MKVLVVDDDFRNIFAMTALLERGHAERARGRERHRCARRRSNGTPDIDIVLMDIMMPSMDGYATIRAIRRSISSRPSHPRGDRQGGARGARALPRRRCQRLRPQAGRHRRAAGAHRPVAPGVWPSPRHDPSIPASRRARPRPAEHCRVHGRQPPVSVLIVDDNPAKRLALRAGAAAARLRDRRGRLRAGRPALRDGAGLRGHPARRPHAGHGRVRNRRR